ncbi:MAG: DUF4232 domain-containing protein [Vulcanimicrobiaceae bacterium]
MIAALLLAAAPVCVSAQISTSITGVNHGAGRAQTTVALINGSDQRCALPAYPLLTFVLHGELVRVKVETAQTGRGRIVGARRAAALTFEWSNMGPDGGDCPKVADALIGWPGSGMPLWVPVAVDSCMSIRQWPLKASVPAKYPDAGSVRRAFDRWFETQPCEPRLLRMTTISDLSTPAVHDALRIDVSRGTNFNDGGRTGQAVAAVEALFDPTHALLATERDGDGYTVTLCADNHSVPYGITYADLAPETTALGARLGMTVATIERIEGAAFVASLGLGYSGVHYHWGGTHDLEFVFYHDRVIAIDYAVSPR